MTKRRLVARLALVLPFGLGLFALPSGCSSSDGTQADPADAASDASAHDPSKNCVKPGTASNAKGVGGYCEKGGDCPESFCSALFGAPAESWFCTIPCKTDDDCGEGAACMSDPRGVACVPIVCGGVLHVDAGPDAAPEASSDGASDAPSDAPSDGPSE